MKLQFSKYHGSGNDFIMVDSRKNVMADRSVATIAALCDRHFGIGADGLIVLEESVAADFRMEYYNSDGRPGTMCGNGGRCTSLFAKRSGWINSDSCRFEASDGLHEAVVLADEVVLRSDGSEVHSSGDENFSEILPGGKDHNGKVHGGPDHGARGQGEIAYGGRISGGKVVSGGKVKLGMQDVGSIEQISEGYLLDTGSPHLVLFVEDVEKVDVFGLGRRFRQDERFKDGTNVNFVQRGAGEIIVRTYERGVEDETLSCGTGVTAAAMATFLDSDVFGTSIPVKTRGGELRVDFQSSQNRDHFSEVFLTGPVTEVFEGVIDI